MLFLHLARFSLAEVIDMPARPEEVPSAITTPIRFIWPTVDFVRVTSGFPPPPPLSLPILPSSSLEFAGGIFGGSLPLFDRE